MKIKLNVPPVSAAAPVATHRSEPTDDAVRDYAYHLYEQSGSTPGRDLENWLEATDCLKRRTTTVTTGKPALVTQP